MSYLTTPQETLEAEVIAALEGEGFAYDPLRHTWPQYLATVLGDPTAYLFKSIAQMLSEVDAQYGGSLSHLRASIARLLDDVAANIGAGGGGGGGIPDWAVAIRDLVSDPADFLFAYNFAAGGTGEGWNNVTQELLTASVWTAPTWGPWRPQRIIDGLGLIRDSGNSGILIDGILPGDVLTSGGTVLLECKAYDPTTSATVNDAFVHLVDLPDDNHEGGIDLVRQAGAPPGDTELTLSNGIGDSTAVDHVDAAVQIVRGVCNYPVDGSDVIGSINGRPTEARAGMDITDFPPNNITIQNNKGTSDVEVYVTIVAVFALQSSATLPTMSALP